MYYLTFPHALISWNADLRNIKLDLTNKNEECMHLISFNFHTFAFEIRLLLRDVSAERRNSLRVMKVEFIFADGVFKISGTQVIESQLNRKDSKPQEYAQ